jgi:hypothetical protein
MQCALPADHPLAKLRTIKVADIAAESLPGAQYADRGVPLAPGIEHRFVVDFPKGLQRAGLVAEFAREARSIARAVIDSAREHAHTRPDRRGLTRKGTDPTAA